MEMTMTTTTTASHTENAMQKLKTLRDDAKLDGSPARQPAHLRYCDECDRLRPDAPGWRVSRADGYPRHTCPLHTPEQS